jgi:hypothetical protein
MVVRAFELAEDLRNIPDLLSDRSHTDKVRTIPRGVGVHIEDLSSIPRIAELPGAVGLQLRARLRASAGDLVLATQAPPLQYEEYNVEDLELGRVRWLLVEDGGIEVARSAWRDRSCFGELVELVRRRPIHIHPYIACDEVWELAARLSHASGTLVPVLGPPPALCAYVNNKIHFTHLVELLLGSDAVVEHEVASSLDSIVQKVREFAQRYPRVAIKRPCCTSALGNLVIDSCSVENTSLAELTLRLDGMLREMKWDGSEWVLITRWEDRVLSSPSVQLWLDPESGVHCEGIFHQRFAAEHEGRFEAAVPATFPVEIERRLRMQSVAVATVLLRLGYVGRCSFDLLIVGDSLESAALRFVDCNGRWGAVSTPMALLNRLLGDHQRVAYAIGDCTIPELVTATFQDLRGMLNGDLYRPSRGTGNLILYNVGLLTGSGKFSLVTLGETQASAEELLQNHLPRALERGFPATAGLDQDLSAWSA